MQGDQASVGRGVSVVVACSSLLFSLPHSSEAKPAQALLEDEDNLKSRGFGYVTYVQLESTGQVPGSTRFRHIQAILDCLEETFALKAFSCHQIDGSLYSISSVWSPRFPECAVRSLE